MHVVAVRQVLRISGSQPVGCVEEKQCCQVGYFIVISGELIYLDVVG